jgi:hypothetical protein
MARTPSYWVQLLQALAVPAIAMLAAVIGFCQWRTAHMKVVIDLFARRMPLYSDCRAILAPIIASPEIANNRTGIEFSQASSTLNFSSAKMWSSICKGSVRPFSTLQAIRGS